MEEETVSENTVVEETISENNINAAMQMSDMEVEANNGLGSLLMDEIQFAADEEKSDLAASYAIAEITVEGKTADVRLNAADDCVVIVGIYAEDSEKLIASGRQYIQTGSSQVDVTIEGELPAYYVVKGYLVEAESQRPLSKVYETRTYTKVMQDFLKKTTADFDANRVVNLDEDEKTNFVVVKDGNKRILEKTADGKTVNQLTAFDEAALTYTFANADETLSGLAAGEIFVWQGEDGNFLVIKVKNITINEDGNGEKIVVIGACADELAADDVFSYVKIEEEIGTADAPERQPSCPDGVTYLGRESAEAYALEGDPSVSLSLESWKVDFDDERTKLNCKYLEGKVSGCLEVGFGVTVTFKYYLGWKVQQIDLNIVAETSVKGELEADGKLAIPMVNDALEVESNFFTLQYTPEFVISITVTSTISCSHRTTFGIRAGYQEDNGSYSYSELTMFQLKAALDGYIGVDFNPILDVTGIFHGELKTGVQLHGNASMTESISLSSKQERENHDCGSACVAITCDIRIPFGGKLQILKFRDYNLEEFMNLDAGGKLMSIELGRFYYSIPHQEFGKGECPHKTKEYLIRVQVCSQASKKPVRNAKVWYSVNGEEETGTAIYTDKRGWATLWLPISVPSSSYVYASAHEEQESILLRKAEPQTVTIYLPGDWQGEMVKGVYAIGYSNSFACLMEDGSLYTWGNGGGGILGNGDGQTDKNKPVKILDDVREVVYDGFQACGAILNNGDFYVWGHNYLPAGSNDWNFFNTPQKVAEGVKKAALGYTYIVVIMENGDMCVMGEPGRDFEIFGEGEVIREPTKVLSGVKEIVCNSYRSSAAILENGDLYMWGQNPDGEIGNGTRENPGAPVKVMDHVKAVDLDNGTSAALNENGDLYMWGNNLSGAVGNGKEGEYQLTPVKILTHVNSVDIGGYATAAINESGDLYMWGANTYGEVGIGTDGHQLTPVKVMGGIKYAWAESEASMAIGKNGDLYLWGYAKNKADGASQIVKTPTRIRDGIESVVASNCGSSAGGKPYVAFAAIAEDSDLYTWGYNQHGQLGLGLENIDIPSGYIDTPTKVDFSTADDVTQSVKNASTSAPAFIEEAEMADMQAFSVETAAPSYTAQTLTAAQSAEVSGSGASRTAQFSGLKPQDIYNIYAMKTRDCEEPLAPDNLLYITQMASGADGNLSLSFEMREAYDEPEVFCVGYTRTDISGAQAKVLDITYDGEEHIAETEVILDGQPLRVGIDYEVYGDVIVKNAGSYKVIVRGKGLYCGEIELGFRVTGAGGEDPGEEDIGDGDVLPGDIPADGVIPRGLWMAGVAQGGYNYTGAAIKPQVRVYDYKTLLQEKRDYTIAYKNHTKAFEVTENTSDTELKKAPTIAVTGKGNYTGKDTQTFSIHALDIGVSTEENLFEADDLSVTSGNKAQKPAPVLWWNGKKLKNKTDYTYTYHQGAYAGTDTAALASVKDAGNYYIKITGKGNFTGDLRVKLTLLKAAGSTAGETALKPASKLTVAKIPGQDYLTRAVNGKVTPTLTVRDGKTTLTENTHYMISYSNNAKPGTAYAIVKGLESGGYSGTKRVSFKINGISIRKAAVKGMPKNLVYNGSEQEPVLMLTVKLNGVETTLVKDTDYTIEWKNNRSVGTATVTFTGKNAYSGTLKKTVRIKAFDIRENLSGNFQAALKNDTVPYVKGGAKPELAVTFKKSDQTLETLKEGTDFTLSYKNNKALHDGSNAVKVPTVVIKGKGNFAGTYAQTLTYKITQQSLENLTVEAADKVYQNKKNIFATKVKILDVDGKTLSAGKDYDKKLKYTYKNDTKLDNGTVRTAGTEVDKNDIIPAGTVITVTAAALTPAGKMANYTGSCIGEYSFRTYDIAKAKVTIPAQTYTGKAITLDKTKEDQILVRVSGKKVEPDQFEIVAGSYKNNVKKGTASVTIRGVDNYGGTKTVTFRIKAKGFLWWWRN